MIDPGRTVRILLEYDLKYDDADSPEALPSLPVAGGFDNRQQKPD